jgi:hypothetical protein
MENPSPEHIGAKRRNLEDIKRNIEASLAQRVLRTESQMQELIDHLHINERDLYNLNEQSA